MLNKYLNVSADKNLINKNIMTAPATKINWVIDQTHSEISFKVRHLMITNVVGQFRKFHAEISTDGIDFTTASIHVVIDAASIFTNEDSRDTHLKSADFFDVEKYNEVTFEGTSFRELTNGNYRLKGILTMKGISKEVSLEVEFGGINKDPERHEVAGFSLAGTINRKDWGLNWGVALETGGLLVSDEVKISADVELVKQP